LLLFSVPFTSLPFSLFLFVSLPSSFLFSSLPLLYSLTLPSLPFSFLPFSPTPPVAQPEFFMKYSAACVAVEDSDSEAEEV
jgi:hypothetical protein